jgi:four helix bundle protein
MQDFKKLDVWHRAHAHALSVRKAAAKFPRRDFGTLKTQLIKAADSIAATIVEGAGAATNKEFARFLDMSIKSASEVEYHLLNARDNKVMRDDVWQRLTDETIEIRKMLGGLRRTVLRNS